MFACGIPIFFQEVAAGQYLGCGGLTMVGQFVPILQGVGYATMTIVFFLDIYYCIIIAWTLFYLLATLISIPELPWGTCGNWWNSVDCFDGDHVANVSVPVKHNGSKTPVEEYWDRRVLQITDGFDDLGGIQWELLGCLVLGWFIVYLIIWKGLHGAGKIIWFTALFPYFVMSILFVRSVTLDGAGIGIYHFFHIRWDKFLNSETWIDSATQIFFAYSIGTGSLPALGSYNKFHHNCVKDTVITCIVNTGTCVFAGIVTFSILGHMAHNQGVEIDKVVASGPGLVFITYPEVVMKLPGGPMWSITFFVMLVTIGIDSEFCLVESLVTGVVDMWPEYLRPRRRLFTGFVCLGLFILGIPMVTNGGAYVFQLMDFYSASGIPILWCCFFQTIAIGWIFGVEKFALCVEQMTGYKPNYYWILTWSIIAPLVMALVFISYFISWTPVKYGEVEYPMFAHIIGFGLSLASMLWIPGYALYYICMQRGNMRDRFVKGITPNIISNRSKGPPRSVVKEMQMSESSARLLKNASFLTKNSSFTAENP
jgi:solute carrier family 6 GABA transporter-like protein 1